LVERLMSAAKSLMSSINLSVTIDATQWRF